MPEPEKQEVQKTQFRGVAIHVSEDGKLGVEPVGITPVEIYGALTLVLGKLKEQLGSAN